jgi:hypothetical protein
MIMNLKEIVLKNNKRKINELIYFQTIFIEVAKYGRVVYVFLIVIKVQRGNLTK